MPIPTETIKRLSELQMSTEAFQEVLSIIADMQAADDTRREVQRQRKAKSRASSQDLSGNECETVTGNGRDHDPKTRVSPSPPITPLTPSQTQPLEKIPSLRSVSTDDGWPEDYREQFWAKYPRKTGKTGALKKLEVVRRSGKVQFDDLLAAVDRYAEANTDPKYTKHPETWLNKGCWDDEIPQRDGGGERPGRGETWW